MFKIGPFLYNFKKNMHSQGNEIPAKKIVCREEIIIFDRELVVISGPSGAGKSTLLLLLKGIIPEFTSGEFEGEILYRNQPLYGENFHKNLKNILFLFQNPFSQLIYPDVAEEFFFSMENFNFTREQMDQKKEEFNEIFNLEILWNKKTNELSNGECQRLVLASLLAIGPDVLLLDEPTAFLDTVARGDFYQWLNKIKGSKTIILVDHHLSQILPLVDKVINVGPNGEVSLGSINSALNFIPPVNLAPVCSDRKVNKRPNIELKLSNINFHYSDQNKLLEDISLTALAGETIVIRGKNGKGKSSLFKIIAGILKPSKGSIRLIKNNVEVLLQNHYKEIGFIFQNPESHFFYDTIREELKSIVGRPELAVLLETFFSGIDLNRSPFLLSEGEKRRLSLMMTIFLDKTILLYDEPTFGQDQQSIATIIDMIKNQKDLGKIQILISHDEDFINSIADKIYNLEGGRLERHK